MPAESDFLRITVDIKNVETIAQYLLFGFTLANWGSFARIQPPLFSTIEA